MMISAGEDTNFLYRSDKKMEMDTKEFGTSQIEKMKVIATRNVNMIKTDGAVLVTVFLNGMSACSSYLKKDRKS